MLEAMRVAGRPRLVDACGRAALAILVGVALVLSVWKGLPATASIIATGAVGCRLWTVGRRRKRRADSVDPRQPTTFRGSP